MIKLFGVKSNWEFVVWYLINSCVTEKHRDFTRSEIIRKDYKNIYSLLTVLGHKKRPRHPEETIQKTLQNMRDKSWIEFLGQGDYKVTDDGYKVLLAQKENIDKFKNFTPEELKVIKELEKTL